MADLAHILDAWVRDALIQTTAVLTVGLLAARYVRLPARAHAVLLMAFVAAAVTPLASGIVRHGGWGLLAPQPQDDEQMPRLEPSVPPRQKAQARIELQADSATTNEIVAGREAELAGPGSLLRIAVNGPQVNVPAKSTSEVRVKATVLSPEAVSIRERGMRPWTASLFAALWLAGTLIAGVRLLRGVLGSGRLMARAEPCLETSVGRALAAARERLGLANLVIDVYQSPGVRCPVIWCWGRRPRLVLPLAAIESWSAEDWTPILCHELAHWKRRDHFTALVAEILCCLMPWQPLAWWAKRRLEQASEQTCDDWAVAAGHSAADYAETLLGLVAQPSSPLQLASLRRKSGLGSRIRHILTQRVPRPRLGRLWTLVTLCFTAMIIGAAAFCQRGVARAEPAPVATASTNGQAESNSVAAETSAALKPKLESDKGKVSTPAPAMRARAMPVNLGNRGAELGTQSDELKRYTAAGRVVGPDGQPIAGANVTWEGRHGQTLDPWREAPEQLVQTTTDGEGKFSVEAELVEKDTVYARLVIRAAGFGLRGYATPLSKLSDPLEIKLEPSYAIEGSVFTPNGEPVKDAQVFVTSMTRASTDEADREENRSWHLGLSQEELKSGTVRASWPAPAVTDASGQFRFADLVPRSATAELIVVANDFAKTHVHVSHGESVHFPQEQQTNWREPNFTLVLENPLVVEGRFIDEKTGKGVAGVNLEVTPNDYGRAMHPIDKIEATSDEEGRYTIRAGSADMYFANVHPPLGYPGISNSLSAANLEKLTGGKGRKVTYDVKLRAGVILRGRVVADDTGDPVSDVDVVYRPERGRNLGVNNDFSSVKTATDGSFEVTGIDGKGFLLVDAPDKGFYRLHVDDKGGQRYFDATYPHALLEVDVPDEGQAEPCVIALKRGRELVVRALDPEGKPVKKLNSAYAEQDMDRFFRSKDANEGLLRINAAQPGRSYRVFLFSDDAMAGTVAEVEVPEDGHVVDVRLEPCATIRGRYIYGDDAPAVGITNLAHFRIDPDKETDSDTDIIHLPFYDNFARHQAKKRTTDDDGNYELDGIVPGIFMYLQLNYGFVDGKNYKVMGTLAPGEIKDMGDLVIQSR